MMKYEELQPISKEAVQRSLTGSDGTASEALIRAAMTIDDVEWVESLLMASLSDKRVDVQRAALLGFGHLARIHRRLDVGRVVPTLQKFVEDPVLGGTAEDALDDISMFIDAPVE